MIRLRCRQVLSLSLQYLCLSLSDVWWPKPESNNSWRWSNCVDMCWLEQVIFAQGQVRRYSTVPWRIISIIMEILAIADNSSNSNSSNHWHHICCHQQVLLHLPRSCPIVLIFTSGWCKTERSQNDVLKGARVSKLKNQEKTRRCKAWWLSPGMFHIFQRLWGCKASKKNLDSSGLTLYNAMSFLLGFSLVFVLFFSFFAIFLVIFHGCSSWAHLVILRSVAGFSKPTSPPSVWSSIPISKLGKTFRASPWTQLGQI